MGAEEQKFTYWSALKACLYKTVWDEGFKLRNKRSYIYPIFAIESEMNPSETARFESQRNPSFVCPDRFFQPDSEWIIYPK